MRVCARARAHERMRMWYVSLSPALCLFAPIVCHPVISATL